LKQSEETEKRNLAKYQGHLFKWKLQAIRTPLHLYAMDSLEHQSDFFWVCIRIISKMNLNFK